MDLGEYPEALNEHYGSRRSSHLSVMGTGPSNRTAALYKQLGNKINWKLETVWILSCETD